MMADLANVSNQWQFDLATYRILDIIENKIQPTLGKGEFRKQLPESPRNEHLGV